MRRTIPWEFWPFFFFWRQIMQFISLRKEPTFREAITGFPANFDDAWGTNPEISYWWRVSTQISVVLLIGWGKCPPWHDQSEHLPDLGSDTSSVWNFCALSSDLIKPEVVSRNVNSFLRLALHRNSVFVILFSFCFFQLAVSSSL